jgi:serine/threonine protein kinase/Flp pilus assembly protein TadD
MNTTEGNMNLSVDPLIGTLIDGRYEVLAHIGKGGMGSVYKVREIASGTEYALKMISPELTEQKILAKRLEHEAIAAKTLTHANIVAIYDVGNSATNAPYLIMDLIEGDGLDTLLKREVLLRSERAIGIFIQITDALVHAHYKGVVHRDLKPSNIILTKTPGGQEFVKIVDFGIAKIADSHTADKTKLTQTGEMLGSPLYMSPEQCKGDEVDGRSDIYSLGCIMYEVVAGKAPFTDNNPVKVILKHLNEQPAELPKDAGISPDLKRVIMRCLEKERQDRYENPQAVLTDLERVRNGKAIMPSKLSKRVLRKRTSWAVGAAVAVAALASSVCLLIQPHANAPSQVSAPALKEQQRPEQYKGKTLAEWTDLIEKSPNDPELYFNRANLHDIRDERTNAIDDFTHAISLKPDYISAFVRRSYLYTMIADYKNALADATKVIDLDPESEEGYNVRAFVNSAMEGYPQASADYRRSISIREAPYPYYGLAGDQLKLGHYKNAEDAINRSIAMGENYNGLQNSEGVAGVIATFKRDFRTAEAWLKKATASDEARGVEWQELAYYYVSIGDMKAAEQAIRQAKALETFPARSYRLAGELYRTAGNFDQALKELSASTSLEEYPPGYREKAVTYLSMGQWRSAHEDLVKSNKLNPFSPATNSYLALTEDHLGMKDASAKHLAQALIGKEVPPIVLVNKAHIEMNNDQLQQALADAGSAISLDPWLKEAYQVRSEINVKLKNDSAAQSDKQKANELVSHLDL